MKAFALALLVAASLAGCAGGPAEPAKEVITPEMVAASPDAFQNIEVTTTWNQMVPCGKSFVMVPHKKVRTVCVRKPKVQEP